MDYLTIPPGTMSAIVILIWPAKAITFMTQQKKRMCTHQLQCLPVFCQLQNLRGQEVSSCRSAVCWSAGPSFLPTSAAVLTRFSVSRVPQRDWSLSTEAAGSNVYTTEATEKFKSPPANARPAVCTALGFKQLCLLSALKVYVHSRSHKHRRESCPGFHRRPIHLTSGLVCC